MSHTLYSSYNEFYDPLLEHPVEDTLLVNQLEEEEKIRRIFDKDGEAIRRLLAHEIAEIITEALRPGWFQQGTSYVFHLLDVAREAGSSILRTSQVGVISSKLQVAGQKGYATAQDVAHKIEKVGHRAQEFPGEVKTKVQEKIAVAQDVAQQKWEKVEDVAHHGIERANSGLGEVVHKVGDVAHQGIERANSGLGEVVHKVNDVAHQGIEIAHQGIEKTQDIITKLKDVSFRVLGNVNHLWTSFTENTNLAFAVLEEENERAKRMTGVDESYAILNALCISNLIKDLSPEFYNPTFEPTRHWSTRALEEIERKRRISEGLYDHSAIQHATALSALIESKFNHPILLTKMKKHVVEEIKTADPLAPATAAM